MNQIKISFLDLIGDLETFSHVRGVVGSRSRQGLLSNEFGLDKST